MSTPSEPGTDISALLQQAQAMQNRLLDAQEELARAQVTGSAGGGLVHATVTGGGEVVGLRIDPAAIDPGDAEGLADLVLAAIRDGNRAALELQNQTLAPLAETMGGISGTGGGGGIGGGGGGTGGIGGLAGGLGLPGR